MVGTLAAIRGQERAVALLRRYLEEGTVPPGLLFSGEEGVGKEKAARAFSAALVCRARGAAGACGACPDCRLAAAGSHPNLLRVEPPPEKASIPIEAVRSLREELARKAFTDRPRVALIVPADRMTGEAANALLKTLEEPPPGTHLILVAHRISRLPPTIASRCQKIPFAPLSPADMAAVLAACPEAAGSDPGALREARGCAAGSPGRALSILAEGGIGRAAWLALLAGSAPAEVVRLAAGWKGAQDAPAPVAVPLSLLRDLSLLSSGMGGDIMNADIEGALREAAARRPAAVWLRAFREFLDLSRMPPHFQRPLPLEAFLFGLDGSQ